MTSVNTAPPVFTDREGYHAAMAEEFGTFPDDSAQFTGTLHDSGISEEELDGLLRDAEQLKDMEANNEEEVPEKDLNQLTKEEEDLMESIAESGENQEEQATIKGQETLQPEVLEPERVYTPDERALMESIQEEVEDVSAGKVDSTRAT